METSARLCHQGQVRCANAVHGGEVVGRNRLTVVAFAVVQGRIPDFEVGCVGFHLVFGETDAAFVRQGAEGHVL